MSFQFDAFVLDTRFRPQPVTIMGLNGPSAYHTSDGRIIQMHEVYRTRELAQEKADAEIEKIQESTHRRRSMGG